MAGESIDRTTSKVGRLNEQLNTAAALIPSGRIADNPEKNRDPFGGQTIDNSTRDSLFKKFDQGSLTADDKATAEQVLKAAKENQKLFNQAGWDNTGFQQVANKAQAVLDRINGMASEKSSGSAASSSTTSTQPKGGTTANYTVNISVNGRKTAIKTASAADADALAAIIRQLDDDAAAMGT
jgi:hypothetical protein